MHIPLPASQMRAITLLALCFRLAFEVLFILFSALFPTIRLRAAKNLIQYQARVECAKSAIFIQELLLFSSENYI